MTDMRWQEKDASTATDIRDTTTVILDTVTETMYTDMIMMTIVHTMMIMIMMITIILGMKIETIMMTVWISEDKD